jgi:hypothetical protein
LEGGIELFELFFGVSSFDNRCFKLEFSDLRIWTWSVSWSTLLISWLMSMSRLSRIPDLYWYLNMQE